MHHARYIKVYYNIFLRVNKQLGSVDGLWTMRSMKENERGVPNDTEAL